MSTAQTPENFDNRDLTQFGDPVIQPNAPFSEDFNNPLRQTIETDDTRNLKTVRDAKTAFRDYLKAKENQVLVFEDQIEGDMMVLPHEHRWSATSGVRQYRQHF